jgi:hypothetical protein
VSAQVDDRASLEAYAALEYDGRIRVDELDIDQRQGDLVGLFEAKARVRAVNDAVRSLTFGYDLSQRAHTDFPDLDRQSHRVIADGRVKVGRVDLGASYDFIHFRLGGEGLVDIQGFEPKLTVPIAPGTRLTASYRHENWNFLNLTVRDSDNHLLAISAAHDLSTRTQLTARVRFEKVDAVEPRFDFRGYQLNLRLSFRLPVIECRDSARLEFEYRDRNYGSITPSMGARRREDRVVITGTSDLYLSESVGVRTIVRYTDRNSNFPASNYEEIRASTGFVLRL